MNKLYTITSLILFSLFLTACSTVNIDTYKDNEPKLVLNEFFNGELTAHGILKNRSGEVIRYFNVDLTGSWNDQGVGTLAEKFIFDDGSIQFRTWTFTPVEQGSEKDTAAQKTPLQYSAKANDTLAPTLIDISGNAFFMKYDLLIDYEDEPLEVHIDDKMYLVSDSVLINESVMTKYGLEVGYITLTIIKR